MGSVTKSEAEGYNIITIAGDVSLGNGDNTKLKNIFQEIQEEAAAAKKKPNILVDLGSAHKIDSSVFGQLIAGSASITKSGGTFAIYAPEKSIPRELLQITKVDTVVDVFQDRTAAVDAVKDKAVAAGIPAPQRSAAVQSVATAAVPNVK